MQKTLPILALLAAASILSLAVTAPAGPVISAAHQYAWGENCGWLNWRGATGFGNAGKYVKIAPTYLRGSIWGENTGWINVGNGLANNVNYFNTDNTNYGVNRDPGTGQLSGYAWGENVGWINFSGGALASPANPARLDAPGMRFRGYAWGENIGWMNLDDGSQYVGIRCSADFNVSGAVTVQDIFDFLAAYFSANASADYNESGAVTVQDIFDYLHDYFAGC